MNMNKLRLMVYLLVSMGMVSSVLAQSVSLTGSLSSQLCAIVGMVRTIVGILAIALFLIGGVLYAVSDFLPTNLEFRKSMIGWATAMIIGGLIGLVIVIIAQPVIQLVENVGSSAGGASGIGTC
ncbi:Uncharacterised protein [uncultured archaeon]|nr:Uncharacterised protein [uncultured archaeon]